MVLPKANHYQWEAEIENNAELASLSGFAPAYFTTIKGWLAKRIRSYAP